MLNFIKQTDSIKTETITCLIYGEPGIGKTSLANTSNNAFLLDFDNGIQRACYRQNSVRIERWEDVNDLKNHPEFKQLNPDTIIVDTAGAMLDNYLADYVKSIDPKNKRRGGELSLQGYGAMKDVFNQFLNWVKSLNCSLIFVAHSTVKDEDKQVPKITGGSYDILQQTCDLIGYMYSNRNERVIDFNPTDNHIGKNCAQFGVASIPNYVDANYKTFFAELINSTLEKMNSLSEEAQKIVEKIDNYKSYVLELKDAESLNKALGELKNESRAVSIQMFQLLSKQAESLEIKYTKKDGFYVED